MFSKLEGKLWVDKQDLGWIKADGRVIQPFSIGLFLARVLRGSHITMEQTRVDGGDLDAGIHRDTSGCENLLYQESGDRSGIDLFGIQAGGSRRTRDRDWPLSSVSIGPIPSLRFQDRLMYIRGTCGIPGI